MGRAQRCAGRAPARLPINPVPERRRVSFTADSLFGFDHAEVRPDGRTALDQFVKELAGTRYDKIVVEGHTDPLGSTAYNLKLAQERADAVKAYLVGRGGIDAAKISTVAKGESQPVTKPEDCKGERETAKLVACLQPDRRVEVEVSAEAPGRRTLSTPSARPACAGLRPACAGLAGLRSARG